MRMFPRSLGAALVACSFSAQARAQDAPTAKAAHSHPKNDQSAGILRTDPETLPTLPSALVESTVAPKLTQPATATTAPGLAEFERIALQRNPTLRQAAAQVDATVSRSFQAGLYPNPTVGYVQEQIGTLGEVTPTASGIATRGRGTPGELVGGFVQQEIVTGGKLRLSRAKFAEEANAARWQADAQVLRVLGGVRIRFFEVIAAQRLIQIQRDLARINDDAVRTTEDLVNVGQANEPDLLQAKIEGLSTT